MHKKKIVAYVDFTRMYLKFENVIPYFFRKSLKVSKKLSILIRYIEGILTVNMVFINSIYTFTGLYANFQLHFY